MPVTVQVLLFATYRQLSGVKELSLEVREGSSLRDIAKTLEERFAGLELNGALCAINEQYARPEATVAGGDTVAFFPPVSGGNGQGSKESANHFFVTEAPLDLARYTQLVSAPEFGACSSFLGTVRSPNFGEVVEHIDYQGYEKMLRAQMAVVTDELREHFGIGNIVIAHRLGKLLPGDASIAIVISSKHRQDALLATQACIDRCKELLPVWKYEVTQAGAHWVKGNVKAVETL